MSSCDELKTKLMDIEFILNDALNKALITDKIKGIPNSNKIADFVSKYVESEQLILHCVSQQRELLIAFENYYIDNDLENVVQPISKDVDDFLAIYSG